jgi:surfactin family lipopeptide synthetase A
MKMNEQQLNKPSFGEKKAIAKSLLREKDLNYALSRGQQAVWLLQQQDKDASAYNEGVTLRMPAATDLSRLKKAFELLTEANNTLRTVYHEIDGVPHGILKKNLGNTFIITNTTGWDEQRLADEMSVFYNTPFNLRESAMRIAAYQTKEDIVVLVVIHHLACDGWSLNILLRELVYFYDKAYDIENIPVAKKNYQTFINEENLFMDSPEAAEAEQYFTTMLQSDIPDGLPVRKNMHNAGTGFVAKKIAVSLSAHKAGELSRQMEVSPFTLMLGALQVLLFHYSDQPDVVIATPFANRSRAAYKDLVGFFANTIVIRQEIDGTTPFDSHLAQLQQRVIACAKHGRLPFSHIVNKTRELSGKGRTLPFQAFFIYRQAYRYEEIVDREIQDILQHPLLFTIHEPPTKKIGQFNLQVEIIQYEQEAQIIFNYNRQSYSGTLINQVASHFAAVIKQLFENPGTKINDTELMDKHEHKFMLHLSKGRKRDYAVELGYIPEFKKQVTRTPGNVAVSDKKNEWTYKYLDTWSDEVAAILLNDHQVSIGQVIGVYLERSVLLTGSVLAIWKAGCIYLPLDPAFPKERINFMVQDAGVSVILTEQTAASLPGNIRHLVVNSDLPERKNKTKSNNPSIKASDGAYMLYTSGSTGLPKGVIIEQGGMLNHLFSKLEDISLDTDTGLAQTATQNFDVSVWQLMAPLLAGGRVLIIENESVLDINQLIKLLTSESITIVQMVPSYLSQVLEIMEENDMRNAFPSLKYLVTAGEELVPALASRWAKLVPSAQIFNGYGPTEAADNIAVYKVQHPENLYSVPIGRPVSNLSIYIVNGKGKLCPPGTIGEIWVSGIAVGRGYNNDWEKSSQHFGIDTFAGDGKDRLFRTGDLGSWNSEGLLEFHGRKDQQIKIRGQRIEPGEIENRLLKYAPISKAAVKYWTDGKDGFVAAYIVVKQKVNFPDAIREYLKSWLPAYMIPSVFIELENMPLTLSGKIDRLHLIRPEISVIHDTYCAPVTPTQKMLCEIWQKLLQLDRVGIRDDFFTVGGHSLLMTSLSNRIKTIMGIEISLQTLFRLTDIESIAEFIDFHCLPENNIAEDFEEIEL